MCEMVKKEQLLTELKAVVAAHVISGGVCPGCAVAVSGLVFAETVRACESCLGKTEPVGEAAFDQMINAARSLTLDVAN